MNGVYKNYLDIDILETGNPTTLVIVDSSSYIKNPESPLLEIIMPGYSKYLRVPFIARQVNTFNSNTLGLTEVFQVNMLQQLPDGVWTFRYKICPYDNLYTDKKHMRVAQLMGKLQNVYNTVNIDNCDCPTQDDVYLQKRITQINILIEGAKSLAEVNEGRASRYYQLADKMTDEILNKFCKNCG